MPYFDFIWELGENGKANHGAADLS
jgi:hypothetical protein